MKQISMPFLEAFPNLDLDPKVVDLLKYVQVERVIVNSMKNRIKIHILSDNWLKKTTVYELEQAIGSQLFAGAEMEVRIIEKFRLSASYTSAYF